MNFRFVLCSRSLIRLIRHNPGMLKQDRFLPLSVCVCMSVSLFFSHTNRERERERDAYRERGRGGDSVCVFMRMRQDFSIYSSFDLSRESFRTCIVLFSLGRWNFALQDSFSVIHRFRLSRFYRITRRWEGQWIFKIF